MRLQQVFHQTVLGDEDFIRFEQELHPHGDLSRDEVKRVYFYFMRFSVACSAFKGRGELLNRLAQSALNNEANMSFHDRRSSRNMFLVGAMTGHSEARPL